MSFTRNLFNSTFKTNPFLDRAIMTGITRISKESIFSDWNNLEVVTTSSNKYSESFGFTQEEVSDALAEFEIAEMESGCLWPPVSLYPQMILARIQHKYHLWDIANMRKPARHISEHIHAVCLRHLYFFYS